MNIRDPEGAHVFEKGLRKIKNKNYTLFFVTENEQAYVKWNGNEYTVTLFTSHDSPPQEYTFSYDELLDDIKNDRFIKIVLKIHNISKVIYSELPFFTTYLPGEECSICTDKLANGKTICVNRDCRHGFHCECIESWLDINETCPICRTPFESVQLSKLEEQVINSFGKKSIKKLDADIKFLIKLK